MLTLLNSCKTREEKGLKHFNKACDYLPKLCNSIIKDSVRIKDSTNIRIKDSTVINKAGETEVNGTAPCDSTEKTFKGKSGNFRYVLKFHKDGTFDLVIKEIQDTKSEYKERDKEVIKEESKISEKVTPPVIIEARKSWFERFQSFTSWLWWVGLISLALILTYFILTFSVPFIRFFNRKK